VPLGSWDQNPGSAILTVAVSALLALDVRVDRAGYHVVGAYEEDGGGVEALEEILI